VLSLASVVAPSSSSEASGVFGGSSAMIFPYLVRQHVESIHFSIMPNRQNP
jgi:hypothetical protein